MESLRIRLLRVLLEQDPLKKAQLALDVDLSADVNANEAIEEPSGIPGRPARPVLVPHTELKQRSMGSVEGRAALLHALCHIEFNAIDLAADACWRFVGMPDEFYRQWANIAKEEAYHFTLLREHLTSLGFDYGSFPAHNALWEMAEKTKHDVLARIALVPRTLEARGLDASPPIKAKLIKAGDLRAGEILDVILRDEVGHVAVGNHWYRFLCDQRGLEPVSTYADLSQKYGAPRPRGPFNVDARKAAGFSEDEIAYLNSTG